MTTKGKVFGTFAAVGIVLAASSLTGHHDDPAPGVTVPATVTPTPTPTPEHATATTIPQAVREAAYLDTVHKDYPQTTTDADVLKYGYATCAALDRGVTKAEVLKTIQDGDYSADTQLVLSGEAGAAWGALCPEHYKDPYGDTAGLNP